jgi:hypothetical protein
MSTVLFGTCPTIVHDSVDNYQSFSQFWTKVPERLVIYLIEIFCTLINLYKLFYQQLLMSL